MAGRARCRDRESPRLDRPGLRTAPAPMAARARRRAAGLCQLGRLSHRWRGLRTLPKASADAADRGRHDVVGAADLATRTAHATGCRRAEPGGDERWGPRISMAR